MVSHNDPEYLEQKKARLKSRKEAPDKYPIKWRNFMLLILICGGGLQVLIPFLMKVYTLAVPAYIHLDITSSSQLQDVFFGGTPWLVWCKEPQGSAYAKHHDALLERVADYMRGSEIHMGVVDCHAPMPKGDSIITKFKITTAPAPHPTLLLVANGERPSVISSTYFTDNDKTPARLLHYVRDASRPTLVKLFNHQDLEKKCLNRKSCALILHQGNPSNATLEMLTTLISRYRLTRFVWSDVNKKQLSNEKALPLVDHGDGPEWPRMLYFTKRKEEATVTDGEEMDDKKPTTALYGRAHRHLFDIDKLASFLDHMTGVTPSSDAQHNPVRMTRPPRLYDRRGKLPDSREKSENKKEKDQKKQDDKKKDKDDKKRSKQQDKDEKKKGKSHDEKMRAAADKARERKRKRDDKNKQEKQEKQKSKEEAEKRDSFHEQHEARQQDEVRRVHSKTTHDEWEDEEVVNLDSDESGQEGTESEPELAPEVDDDERQHDEL